MKTHDSALVRLVYSSRMTKMCGPQELADIMEASRKNNDISGITGALCYASCGFLQCLEGSRQNVNEIYRRIVNDPRNDQVTLLSYSSIDDRLFGRWSMAYVRADTVDRSILLQHGLNDGFDPFELNPDDALGFLYDIAKERAAFLASQLAPA